MESTVQLIALFLLLPLTINIDIVGEEDREGIVIWTMFHLHRLPLVAAKKQVMKEGAE